MTLTVRPDVRWAMKMRWEIKNLPSKPPPCDCVITTTTQGYRVSIIPAADARHLAPACPNRAAWAVAWRRGCGCGDGFTSAVLCDQCKTQIVDSRKAGCQSCGEPVTFTYIEPIGRG